MHRYTLFSGTYMVKKNCFTSSAYCTFCFIILHTNDLHSLQLLMTPAFVLIFSAKPGHNLTDFECNKRCLR